MDATVAVSEAGVNQLMQKLLSTLSASDSGSSSWGPFTVGYSASVALSGGSVSLIDPDTVHLDSVNVSGSVGVFFDFDLGALVGIDNICIPPFQICVDIPFLGEVCTPQVCISLPHIHVPITLPFSVNVSGDFHITVTSTATEWQVGIEVVTSSIFVDLTPMASAITNAIQSAVDSALSGLPGIVQSVIDWILGIVLGALNGVLTAILAVISAFVKGVILLVSLFQPGIAVPLISFPKVQQVLPPGGPADPAVDLTVTALGAAIQSKELVATADVA